MSGTNVKTSIPAGSAGELVKTGRNPDSQTETSGADAAGASFETSFEAFAAAVAGNANAGQAPGQNELGPFVGSVSLSGAATASAAATARPAAVSTSSASSSATSGTAVPAWAGTLTTASIAADMKAADVNGTITYAGLDKLLTDLDQTLTSSKTALTAAEFSDLKTIVTNLNNGVSTSVYLTAVMKDLVGGSTENATWTGGAATSTALGNLAAGSSATQLSDLIGKWFLGTDLPSSKVSMSGSATFSISYTASADPVFAASGPSMNDVNQGYLGDCYLLSSLAEVAKQNSSVITSMITSNGNNTYGVRFFVGGVAEYVTVNNALPNNGTIFNDASDIWASLTEKAYAQLQTAGPVTGNSVNSGNSFSTIGNGGCPEYALEEITGASAITDFSASRTTWTTSVYNSSLHGVSFTSGSSTAAILSILDTDIAKGDDLILSSYTNARDSSGKTTLVADHAMSIYGFDCTTDMLEIRNPWGSEAGQNWDTTFEVSLTTLLGDGDTITVDNIGTNVISAPVLSAQTAAQSWKTGQAVNLSLASGTFTEAQPEMLTYSATQSNGAALPSWLTFNGTTDTFSGTAPSSATSLSVKVTATNTSGLSASETFAVSVAAAASQMTQAIAATGSGSSASVSSTHLVSTPPTTLVTPAH